MGLEIPFSISTNYKSRANEDVFPNPLAEKMTVKFKLEHSANCLFELMDINGIQVKTLLHTRALAGKNEFAFSMEPFIAGTYFLRISVNGKIIATEKVIKL